MMQQLRFLYRLIVFALLVFVFAALNIVHGVLLTLLTFKTRHPSLTPLWGTSMTRVFALLGGTDVVVVEGREHLEEDQSCVFVANHQSSLDMLVMMAIWPKKTVAVAKQSVAFMPLFGMAAYLNGTIFINRKDSQGAKQHLNNVFKGMLARKERIWFFPEGTRNRTTGEMLPFKKGAFHMAVAAQVPIVPIVITSMAHFYSRSEMRWDAASISVAALPPVPTTGLSKDDLPELMENISKQMQSAQARINSVH